eukprot:764898-Hanusia_phi.AAC.21
MANPKTALYVQNPQSPGQKGARVTLVGEIEKISNPQARRRRRRVEEETRGKEDTKGGGQDEKDGEGRGCWEEEELWNANRRRGALTDCWTGAEGLQGVLRRSVPRPG